MSEPAKVTAAAPTPGEQIQRLATGYIPAISLHTAAALCIADQLEGGPKNVSELSRAAHRVNEDALYRVLRALASMEIFTETAPRTFANTPASELLRTGTPDSMRDIVLWISSPLHFRVFAEMMHAVETGETAVKRVTGFEAFDYFKQNPADDKIFNAAMTAFSARFTSALLEAYDFGELGTLADIGGGHGYLLTAILQKHPKLRGIVFDAPHVAAGAGPKIQAAGLADRCDSSGGDFFQSVPTADSYVMKSVIHDWDDGRAVTILKNCAAAMRGNDGKVILLDSVLIVGNEPDFAKWIDLEMLMMAGGRERTEAQFAQLLAKAGLRLTRVVRTKSPLCVIESVKA